MSHHRQLPGFVRAPNQGLDPELYEIENQALDRGNLVWDALGALAPWAAKSIVDVGRGT